MSLLRRRMMMQKQNNMQEMEWEYGDLGIWSGEEIESTRRIRTKGFYQIEAGTYEITNAEGSKIFCYFIYNSCDSAPVKCGGYYQSRTISITENAYLRLLLDTKDFTKTNYISIKRIE